jgi:DNA-3-methyladenine glycosylase II
MTSSKPNLTPAQLQIYQQAQVFLSQIDDDWQQLIDQIGECRLSLKTLHEPYEALVRAVAYQQLHGKAASAILARFLNLYTDGFPTAQQILNTDPDIIRQCGFSSRKVDSIQHIAQAQHDGNIPSLPQAVHLSDEELIKQLIQLKGVGRWTVEMFLIHTLGRVDVFPIDDFGVVDGYKRLKRLDKLPNKKDMKAISGKFSPFRSIAAWYLWQVPR